MKIELTEASDVQAVLNALAAQPYREVAVLMAKLMEQVREQQEGQTDAGPVD